MFRVPQLDCTPCKSTVQGWLRTLTRHRRIQFLDFMFMNGLFINDAGAAYPITISISMTHVVPNNRNARGSGTTTGSRHVSSPLCQTIHKLHGSLQSTINLPNPSTGPRLGVPLWLRLALMHWEGAPCPFLHSPRAAVIQAEGLSLTIMSRKTSQVGSMLRCDCW
jgi:hypothetical protein